MAIGLALTGLQIGFVLMVGAWVLMLQFLRRCPMTFTTRDPFGRWMQFYRGESVPAEHKSAHRLITTMGVAGLGILGLSFVVFFVAGGPAAVAVP